MAVKVAQILVLWLVASVILAPFAARFILAGAREMPPIPEDTMADPRELEPDPPDYQVDEDDPFVDLFFAAARERDEEDGDG